MNARVPFLAGVNLKGVRKSGCGKKTFLNGIKIGKLNGWDFMEAGDQRGNDIFKALFSFVFGDLVSLKRKRRRSNFEIFIGNFSELLL